MSGPGGCLVPGGSGPGDGGGVWSWGGLVPDGCLILGVSGPRGHLPGPGGVPGQVLPPCEQNDTRVKILPWPKFNDYDRITTSDNVIEKL